MTKIFRTIFTAASIALLLVYLSACLIPFLPSGKYWFIAGLGLIFPLLFILVFGFLVTWIIAGSKKWSILFFLALLLSWQQLSVIAGLNKRKFSVVKTSETLRVLSWNVSAWGETNKSKDYKIAYLPSMLNVIKRQQPDIVCLQEFWNKQGARSTISTLDSLKKMGLPYSYFVRSYLFDKWVKTGVAIISRYPLTDTAMFNYGEDDFAEHLIQADVLVNDKKIRIFTTHLQSVRFDNSEYTALRKIKRQDESGLKDSKVIVHKLKSAYNFRGKEADFVKQKIKESPYPVVICGDFNDVPNSYTYFAVKSDLQDAFLEKGTGIGRTFQYISPTLRIDYILADKAFRVEQFDRLKVPYSDHYPIVADLYMGTQKK